MIVLNGLKRSQGKDKFLPLDDAGEMESFLAEQLQAHLAQNWGVECEVSVKK